MPFYVEDPLNPDKPDPKNLGKIIDGDRIDVIELQKRNPLEPLKPVLIKDWLKHDLWTRIQAIQLLAGYIPDNQLSITNPKRYLDGTSDVQLSPLIHPMRDEILSNIMTLSNWAGLSEANETKPPQEWLAWAKEKGFKPYWLEYVEAIQSAPTPKVEAETDTPQENTPQDNAARVGEVLAMVGHGLLFMEVAKLEAEKALQNNLSANQLFNRYVSLKGKSDGKCEPMPPPHIADAKPTPTPKVKAGHDDVKRAGNKAANTPDNQTPTNNWIMKVQAEATRKWKELAGMGCSPTRNSIKDDLANWCRDEKNNIKTNYGIFPTAEYIYRHVIRKAKWKSPTE